MLNINRIILIVLDSVGVGELPDAFRYSDVGSNTLEHIFEQSGKDFVLENMGNDSVIINGDRGGAPQDAYNIIETDKLIDDTVNYCKSINLNTEQGKALANDRIQKMAIVIAAKVGKQNDSAYIAKVYNTIYKQL